MLNISDNSVRYDINDEKIAILVELNKNHSGRKFSRVIIALCIIFILLLFAPWTQNVNGNGHVTTLRPDQRPQTINNIIPGKIEKWFVKEGDFVHKGDTIIYISEVKEDYFDPNLLNRTEDQLRAKENSVRSYMNKISALDNQVDALVSTSNLKLVQTQNKLKQSRLKLSSDSMKFQAAKTDYSIAKSQYDRYVTLHSQGLKSTTDLENRNQKLQKTQSDLLSAENDLLSSRNEVINANIELTSIAAQYRDKIAKTESEKAAALSDMYDAEATVTKIQSQYMNYNVRSGYYFITAPQDGYITKALQVGIGETIKEGAEIVSIMPSKYDLAVETYIRPLDLPLVKKGEKVRLQFDGWPAIVFSGWPNISYGTYGGRIFAIDNFISENGMYRILVEPDNQDYDWPKQLRVGSGTRSMILLNDVPIWYELWRNINGFPPDFYTVKQTKDKKNEK